MGLVFSPNTAERRDWVGPANRGACLLRSEVCDGVLPAHRGKPTEGSRRISGVLMHSKCCVLPDCLWVQSGGTGGQSVWWQRSSFLCGAEAESKTVPQAGILGKNCKEGFLHSVWCCPLSADMLGGRGPLVTTFNGKRLSLFGPSEAVEDDGCSAEKRQLRPRLYRAACGRRPAVEERGRPRLNTQSPVSVYEAPR